MQHCCAMLGHVGACCKPVSSSRKGTSSPPDSVLGDFQRQVPLWMPMSFTTPIFISQFCVARQKINGAVFVLARSILKDDESIQVFMSMRLICLRQGNCPEAAVSPFVWDIKWFCGVFFLRWLVASARNWTFLMFLHPLCNGHNLI